MTQLNLHPDISDHELNRLMQCAESKDSVTIVISGFAGKQLFDIPKVQQFCKKLIQIGFFKQLMTSTLLENCVERGFGAFEVWMIAKGLMKEGECNLELHQVKQFLKDLGHQQSNVELN